jgi:putative multicomponent Na+:H+ antiporter subunit B
MEVNMFKDIDFYILAIVTLLPVTASLLVVQVNPYQALVIRGILGAIAALLYALFGAADVALTEALVGTMLSITLYAIAVRSSMSMRLGILAQGKIPEPAPDPEISPDLDPPEDLEKPFCISYAPIIGVVQNCLKPYHLRLEIVPYPTVAELQTALHSKEIHSICLPLWEAAESDSGDPGTPYQIQTRLQRLYEILQEGVLPAIVTLTDPHSPEPSSPPSTPNPVEA